MSELIEKLFQLVVEKLSVNSSLDSDQQVSELRSEIESDPQFAALLQTNTLMIQINQGNAQALQIVVEGGVAYIGEHHYHVEPERLEEIVSKLIGEILAINTRSIFHDHQPPDTSGFQGRNDEFNQIQQWLSGDITRLVGIVSPGGYGKSTLAARLYEEPSKFEQKLWITFNNPCNFRDFSSGLLERLGQKVNSEKLDQNKDCNDESWINALIDYFANHSFLLILDNLEILLNQERQFIDIGYQNFLLQWLTKKNASTILLTSREQPAVLEQRRNECQWVHLKGMTDDAGIQLLRNLHITGIHQDLQRFTQIADGHPLLLKLAASWLHDRSADTADVEHILNQGDIDLFTQLVGIHLTQLIGIHRRDPKSSIGRLLADSMERLTPRLRGLWLNLSVYKYLSVNLAAAQAVVTEPITAEDLQELAKRSLLEEQKSKGQYRFLKLVKDFAIQQAGNQTEAKEKAIEYCRSVAMPSGWKNQGDIVEYLEIFDHYYELGQFTPAFDFLWRTGCDAFLEMRGYNSIRVELYTKLKQAWAPFLDRLSDDKPIAEMLNCLGNAYYSLGKYVPAIDSHKKALNLFCQMADRGIEQARSFRNLGKVYHSQGYYQKAKEYFEQARSISQKINDTWGEISSVECLIDINTALGEHQKNIDLYQSLLASFRQLGYRLGEANTLNNLGITYKKIGQYQDAVDAHRQALKVFQELDDKQGQVESWCGLGDAYEALETHDTAINVYQEALQISDKKLKQANILCQLGWALESSGQSEEAIKKYQQALAIFREIGKSPEEAIALNGLGVVNYNLINYPQAESYYQNALKIYREFQDRDGEAVIQNNLGLIYEQKGDIEQAINSYRESLKIYNELPDRDLGNDTKTRKNLGGVCNLLGKNYYDRRQYQQAVNLYQQALSAFEEIKGTFRTNEIQKGKATALLGLGNAYHFLGQYSDAVNLHQKTLEITRRLGDRLGEAEALLGLGNTYYSLGDYNKPDDKNALKVYQEALKIFQELDAKQGKARVKLGLGKIYHSLGQCQRKALKLSNALSIFKRLGDRAGEADAQDALGKVYQSQGRYDNAIASYEEALKIRREIDDLAGRATSKNNLGDVYHDLGNYEEAKEAHKIALDIFYEPEIGAIAGLANAHNSLGVVYCSLEQYNEAIKFIKKARNKRYEIGDRAGEADSLCNLANIKYLSEDYSTARKYYEEAMIILTKIGHREFQAKALKGLGHVDRATNKYENAVSNYEKASKIFLSIGNTKKAQLSRQNQANTYYEQGESLRSRKNYEQAINAYEQAQSIFLEISDNEGVAKCQEQKVNIKRNQAEIYYKQGEILRSRKNYEQAINNYEQAQSIFVEIGDNKGVAKCQEQTDKVRCEVRRAEVTKKIINSSYFWGKWILIIVAAGVVVVAAVTTIYFVFVAAVSVISFVFSVVVPVILVAFALAILCLVVWVLWQFLNLLSFNFFQKCVFLVLLVGLVGQFVLKQFPDNFFPMPDKKTKVTPSLIIQPTSPSKAPLSGYRFICQPNQSDFPALSVRQLPGFSASVVSTIPCNTIGVQIIGKDTIADGEVWVVIKYGKIQGWSLKRFLSEP